MSEDMKMKQPAAMPKMMGKVSMEETSSEELMSAMGSKGETPVARKGMPPQGKVLGSEPRGQGG